MLRIHESQDWWKATHSARIPHGTRSQRAPPHTAQASSLAAPTPTPGCAHVLAEREAEKAGIFRFYSGRKNMILLFSLLWEIVQAQEESWDAGQPKGNDKYPI